VLRGKKKKHGFLFYRKRARRKKTKIGATEVRKKKGKLLVLGGTKKNPKGKRRNECDKKGETVIWAGNTKVNQQKGGKGLRCGYQYGEYDAEGREKEEPGGPQVICFKLRV